MTAEEASHGTEDPRAQLADPARPAARPGTVKPQLAPETLRLYAGDWAHFRDFCAERGHQALPASPESVVAFLATPGRGRAAMARQLAAIDHQHRRRGLALPGADPGLRAALRTARRTAPRRPRPPAPSPATLVRMAQACRGDLAGHRDRALLLLLAAGLGRAAVVALQAEHLRFTESGLAMAAIPGGDPSERHALPRAATPAACPVRAVEDWLRHSATRYGPVFRMVNRWGQLEYAALGTDAIRVILTRRAAALRPRA